MPSAGHDAVEIVAADLTGGFWNVGRDLLGLALGDAAHGAHEVGIGAAHHLAQVGPDLAEACRLAVREHGLDLQHIVDRDAVAKRAGAAGVVGRHAAQRRPRAGRDVDGIEEPF